MLPSVFGDNLFDEFFGDSFGKNFFHDVDPFYTQRPANLMKTDIREVDGQYALDIDLPGFHKEDLGIELDKGYLTITASRSNDNDQTDQQGRYIRRERYSGRVSRTFYVGDLRSEEISAKYEDGILHLTLPRQDQRSLPSVSKVEIQ